MDGSVVVNGTRDIGSDLDHHADCPIRNLAITQTNYEYIFMKYLG